MVINSDVDVSNGLSEKFYIPITTGATEVVLKNANDVLRIFDYVYMKPVMAANNGRPTGNPETGIS